MSRVAINTAALPINRTKALLARIIRAGSPARPANDQHSGNVVPFGGAAA